MSLQTPESPPRTGSGNGGADDGSYMVASSPRLQIPGMFSLSPSNKTASPMFSSGLTLNTNSPTMSPRKTLNAPSNPAALRLMKDTAPSSPSSVSSVSSAPLEPSSTPTISTPTSASMANKRSLHHLKHPSPLTHSPLAQKTDGQQQQGSLKLKQLVHRRVNAIKLDESTVSLRGFSSGVTLGTGTFGRVQLVKHKAGKQPYYALKTMKKTDIIRLKQVDHIMSEAALLKELSHPFIVNLCATFQDSKRLYLILEYVPGGELFSFLRRERKISDDSARFYASEIVLALDYLHQKDIAYRDLKPENLLLSRSGHLKITDFGFAKKVDGRTWTLCGTPEYLAPEIIQSKGHGKSVDWWALGILIYEMLAGYPPYYEENPLGIYQKILRGHIDWPHFFDSRARELISKLLKPDPTQRLGCLRNGAEDVANEAWFAKVDWQSVLDRFIPAPFFPPVAHPGDSSNFDEYEEEDEEAEASTGSVKLEDNARFERFGPVKDDEDRSVFLKTAIADVSSPSGADKPPASNEAGEGDSSKPTKASPPAL